MLRHIPHRRYGLFPYTTLFRSVLGTKVSLARSRKGGRIVIEYYSDEELGRLYDRLTGDRKSTRLNSSHITISYAVFCLKKKTVQDVPLFVGNRGDGLTRHGVLR